MLRILERLYNKHVSAWGLAVFRVSFCSVLLAEVLQLFYFRHLVFDDLPFVRPYEIDFGPALGAWILVIVFLIVGFYTRVASIINYLFSLVFIATITTYEYHMFYVYLGISFLLMFLEVSHVGSLDCLIRRLKSPWQYEASTTSGKVSVLNYYLPLFVGIAFVYFDSIFYKLTSYNWIHGLGMWLPASMPQISQIDSSIILNLKWLSIGLGFLTFFFEAVFILTFFRKRWRVPLLIVGLGLHFGILLQFAIPWFGLGVIALYLLMVPVSWWEKIGNVWRYQKPKGVCYYDAGCLSIVYCKILLEFFDIFGAIDFKGTGAHGKNEFAFTENGSKYEGFDALTRCASHITLLLPITILLRISIVTRYLRRLYANHFAVCNSISSESTQPILAVPSSFNSFFFRTKIRLITIGVSILIIFQVNVTYNSALMRKIKKAIGLTGSEVDVYTQKISKVAMAISKTYFGIVTHGVFMDDHFKGYNHIIGVEAVLNDKSRIWLPIVDKNGHPDLYAYSFSFVKWTFRVNSPLVDNNRLIKGIRNYTTFWAFKHRQNYKDIKYNIYVKEVDVPTQWERNFLREQMARSWQYIGQAYWEGDQFIGDIPRIE